MKRYFHVVWKEIVLRLGFHLIYMCAIATLPYIIKYMIDSNYKNGFLDVVKWTGIFLSSVIIGMLAQYISQRSAWKLDEKFYKEIRKDFFNVIVTKLPSDFDKNTIGEYNTQISDNIDCCEQYIEYCMEICESFIGLIVYAIYILLLDIRVAIVIYVTAIITLFLPRITGEKLSIKKRTLLSKTGIYSNVVIDLLKGFSFINHSTINSISGEHFRYLEKMERARYDYGKFKSFTNVLNGSVMYIVNTAAFAIIAVLLYANAITVGVATATISYIQDFMYPLRTIIDSISAIKSVKGVEVDIITSIENCRTIEEREISFNKEIVVDNVSTCIGSFVLNNKSFIFTKGNSYAIIGENGMGKSILLSIISSRLVSDVGSVYIDDKKVDYDMCNQIMYYANQESHIFNASYVDNVTLFGSYEEQDNLDILKVVTDYSMIKHATNCTELSGGEKQLILLNRALFSGREILILDEPFSAMNSTLENIITEYILRMGKTIIMVTHNNKMEYLKLFDHIINL